VVAALVDLVVLLLDPEVLAAVAQVELLQLDQMEQQIWVAAAAAPEQDCLEHLLVERAVLALWLLLIHQLMLHCLQLV
jgi:hypothetical protein